MDIIQLEGLAWSSRGGELKSAFAEIPKQDNILTQEVLLLLLLMIILMIENEQHLTAREL